MSHNAKAISYTAVPTMEPQQMSYPQLQLSPLQANHMFVGAEGVPAPQFSDPNSKKKNNNNKKKKNRKKRRSGCLFFCCTNIELGDEDHKDKILQCLERATNSDHPMSRIGLYMCCTNVALAPNSDQDGHNMMKPKGSGTKL